MLFSLGNIEATDIGNMEGTLINSAYLSLTSRNKFWKFKVPQEFCFPELEASEEATGNDGDAYISEPSDSLYVSGVWDKTSDKELGYKDHGWYIAQTGRADADSEAEPNFWIPRDRKLYLYPTLNAEYKFTIYYRKRIEELVGEQTTIIGKEWDGAVSMLALIWGFMHKRDFDKAKEWRDEFILTIQDLMGMQVKRARGTRDRLVPSSQHTMKHGY